ncbi:MAG: hypothetical protein HY741_22815 [Chloroflexi bacterium]|nr:hypothetical protein [Chloroflexota bacterium]
MSAGLADSFATDRAGGCPTALVVARPRWWLPDRAGGCPTALVVARPRWWLPDRAGGCPTGMGEDKPSPLR